MRRLLTPLLVATAIGCNSESPTAPDRPITAVAVAPATTSMLVGQSSQLAAAVTGGFGRLTVTWTSSNTSVATVNDSGRVAARALGTARITATAGGISGTADVSVVTGVNSIAVTPTTSALIVGQSAQLAASTAGLFANPTITWSSSNPAVATVTSTGQVAAVGAGTATVSASTAGLSASATITVTSGAVDRVGVCDGASPASCVASATLAAIGTSVTVRATAFNALGADISASCVFQWAPSIAGVLTITHFGDATKRNALVTRAGLGILSVLVSCNGIPGVFTIGGPAPTP